MEREEIMFARWEKQEEEKIQASDPSNVGVFPTSNTETLSHYKKHVSDKPKNTEEKKKEEITIKNKKNEENNNTIDDSNVEPESLGVENLTKRTVSIETVRLCQLSRKRLVQNFEEPFFVKMCVNSFVRLFLGVNEKDHSRIYRVAQVVSVVKADLPYRVDRVDVTKKLKLKFGKDEKNFRFDSISNQIIKQVEYEQWKKFLERGGEKIPYDRRLKKHFEKNIHGIEKRYRKTDQEVVDLFQKKLEKKQFDKLSIAVLDSLLIEKKASLQSRMQVENKSDRESREIEELNNEIKEILKIKRKNSARRSRTDDVLERINLRHELKNKELSQIAGKINKEETKGEKFDPFKRSDTTSNFWLKGLIGKDTKEDTPVTPTDTTDDNKQQQMEEQRKKKQEDRKRDVQEQKLKDAHDFDIDFDIDLPDIEI